MVLTYTTGYCCLLCFQADGYNDRLRVITIATAAVTTLAGNVAGFVDGQGTAARFSLPVGVAMDAAGSFVVVGDLDNDLLRRVDVATGVVTTLAGQYRVSGSADGLGSNVQFDEPCGISLDATGAIGYSVRRVLARRLVLIQSRA